jgi:hypothetical protein
MSTPDFYSIKNWAQFQHYKDRNPAWIKMHVALLSSEDWVMLDDASRLLAVVCMLIASKHEGRVPNKPDYIKRVAYLDQTPDLAPLISCGFLSEPLADASTAQADAPKRLSRGEERRGREEERREEPGANAPAEVLPIDAKTALYRDGLQTLADISGRPATSLRGVVTNWLKRTGDDHARIHAAILQAKSRGVLEPVSWIEAGLKPKDPDEAIYRGVH